VRSYPAHPHSTFSILPMLELDAMDINLVNDDLLINPVTKDMQLMRGATLWRGARERDSLFLYGEGYFKCKSIYSCLSQGRPPYCGHGG
jgi:hypothetical protein